MRFSAGSAGFFRLVLYIIMENNEKSGGDAAGHASRLVIDSSIGN
jgi:hypothetical protein